MADVSDGTKGPDNGIYVSSQVAASPTSTLSLDKAGTKPTQHPKDESPLWRIPILIRARKIYSKRTGSSWGSENGEQRRSWYQTVLRLGPLSGVFALLLVLLSIVASLGVLAGSDNAPVSSWPTTPSTFIAIFTAIGNLSMRYAAIQGVIIAWWVRALKGSSVGRLHHDWRAVGWLGLACIFSTLVIVDGPLLQRASFVVEAHYENPLPLQSSLVSNLPRGYTGLWGVNPAIPESSMFNMTMPSANGPISNTVFLAFPYDFFDPVVEKWIEDKGYPDVIKGCPGVCSAKLIAPALAVTKCTTSSTPINFTTPYSREDLPSYGKPPNLKTLAFAIAMELVVDGPDEVIDLYTGYSTTEQCLGTYTYKTCNLKAAIGEYDVTVQGNNTFLDSALNPKILKIVDNPVLSNTHYDGFHLSTLAGLLDNVNVQYATYVVDMTIDGELNEYTFGTNSYIPAQRKTLHLCPDFVDPTDTVVAAMNKFMVYFAMAATQGVVWQPKYAMPDVDYGYETNTTITGYATGQHSVYHTQYGFFIGATIFEIICICLVAPTYWGWWKIGRSISFSPLEIAKAFEAPLLADSNSNSTGRDMADAHMDLAIQLSVGRENGRSRLALLNPEIGQVPEHGSYFDD